MCLHTVHHSLILRRISSLVSKVQRFFQLLLSISIKSLILASTSLSGVIQLPLEVLYIILLYLACSLLIHFLSFILRATSVLTQPHLQVRSCKSKYSFHILLCIHIIVCYLYFSISYLTNFIFLLFFSRIIHVITIPNLPPNFSS